jgi:hypothetical protein
MLTTWDEGDGALCVKLISTDEVYIITSSFATYSVTCYDSGAISSSPHTSLSFSLETYG